MRLTTTRMIELTVAVSVVVISVASLFVAVEQSRVQRQTLEASVLPVIQYGTGNYNLPMEEWRLTLSFTNTGIGPAEVRYMELIWDGEPVRDTSEFIARCCIPDDIPPQDRLSYVHQAFRDGQMAFLFDSVEGRFFAPQEEVEYIVFRRPDAEAQPVGYAIWQELDRARQDVSVEVCYCSVFEDCWMARFPAQTREPVDMCPVREPEDG
ncbi:hypothetical protein [Hyphobacterium indicum]|uniref:hypothetical protein n=1 Tax=Hyphobacterium indicum TaxID=2162714 RepID=UPI000F634E0E|nr:hypothetical protein [Hyphobacterium indicum]